MKQLMPLWRGSALVSVFTRSATTCPWIPLEIQVLVPLMMYSPPSRRAVVRTACKSVPQSGSVSARPPRSSPAANFGSQWRRCSSVPERCTSEAMIRWELMMPASDIQTSVMRSITFA